MNIVVLDGFTLNPGDLSWRELEKISRNVVVYDRTPNEQIVERAEDAEIVITNKTPLQSKTLQQLPRLKYIGVLATGFDVVDIEEARKRGITVTNIPAYGTDSVAQFVFALLLELCHHVGHHSESVKNGVWSKHDDWCYRLTPLIELAGKTMGIIGYGRIGRKTGEIARAFGMNIIAHNPNAKQYFDDGTRWCELEDLLRQSDVISLHCPLTPENKGFMDKDCFKLMKRSAILINTSRGQLVNEYDLANALNEGIIAGAGLDVLSQEPPALDNPLFSARNCILTPHMAWSTKEARGRLLDMAVENVQAFLSGAAINVVNE